MNASFQVLASRFMAKVLQPGTGFLAWVLVSDLVVIFFVGWVILEAKIREPRHPPSREHFSLKIDVRDQTIWNCILEL